ncbi:MAG: malate dehydrogenase, partial [Anaerolineae bacterium]|nr:malate dehydrogenase [Anaerolineae bacterium]
MARKKVTIVGAGNVGATCAHWIASKELADVVLVDIVEGAARGKALDLLESAPVMDFDLSIIGSGSYD